MRWTDPNAVTYVMTAEEYDPAANTWTQRAPCPMDPAFNNVYGNVHIRGASANGRLYLVVGNTNTPGSAATYEYDPTGNAWTTKAPPPFGLADYAVAELDGKIYLLASQSNGANPGATSKLAQYDPGANVWIIRASLSNIWWAGLVGSGGKVYALGGAGVSGGFAPPSVRPTGLLAAVYEYDPASDAWRDRGGFNVARHTLGAAALGTDLYVTGGSSSSNEFAPTPVATVEKGVISSR
jgi:hypothetical protein